MTLRSNFGQLFVREYMSWSTNSYQQAMQIHKLKRCNPKPNVCKVGRTGFFPPARTPLPLQFSGQASSVRAQQSSTPCSLKQYRHSKKASVSDVAAGWFSWRDHARIEPAGLTRVLYRTATLFSLPVYLINGFLKPLQERRLATPRIVGSAKEHVYVQKLPNNSYVFLS